MTCAILPTDSREVLSTAREILPWSSRYECGRCKWTGQSCELAESRQIDRYGLERRHWAGICPNCQTPSVRLVRT